MGSAQVVLELNSLRRWKTQGFCSRKEQAAWLIAGEAEAEAAEAMAEQRSSFRTTQQVKSSEQVLLATENRT